MKATKYLALGLAFVAVMATIGWFLRNSLIERFTNPLLAEYGLLVTDVSFDAFGLFDNDASVVDATIGYLELEHTNGTVIVIEKLTLPIRAANNRFKRYSARKVSIVTNNRDDEAPLELALLLAQFLSLPEMLAGTDIFVDEFRLAPYPVVHDIDWQFTEIGQELRFTTQSFPIVLASTSASPANYSVSFSLPSLSATMPYETFRGDLHKKEQGILITGNPVLDLPAWEKILKLTGLLPAEFELTSGTVEFNFQTDIPYDVSQVPSLTAAVTPTSPVQITYKDVSGDAIVKLAGIASPFSMSATFPDATWSAAHPQLSLLVTYDDWIDIPITVNEFSCSSALSCSLKTRIALQRVSLDSAAMSSFEFISAQEISFPDEGIRLQTQPEATLKIGGLDIDGISASRVEAQLVSAATLQFTDAGWHLIADSIDASIEELSLTDELGIAMPLYLEKINVSDEQGVLSASAGIFAPSIRGKFGNQDISVPGLKGEVSRRGKDIKAQLVTVGLAQDGNIDVQYSLDTASGELTIRDATMSFANKKLSSRFSSWGRKWDLSAGAIALDLQSNWEASGSDLKITGKAAVRLADLGGFYTDTAFTRLNTNLGVDYNSDSGFTTKPATINVGLVDVGLPLENISASISLDPGDLSADIEQLQLNAFGGVIRADPFSFHTAMDSNNLTLHAESIELSELLAIKEFAAIEVTGSITADLPMTIAEDGVTITDGKLSGVPPGGVIRYRPDSGAGAPVPSSIGLVTAALSNFEYESLAADVSYSKDGDLKLQMQLKGRNPDLQEKRPVVLNLGVENNVPQMLRSLQAARSVEDILERRMAK
jgi:hypothetical protein